MHVDFTGITFFVH